MKSRYAYWNSKNSNKSFPQKLLQLNFDCLLYAENTLLYLQRFTLILLFNNIIRHILIWDVATLPVLKKAHSADNII